MATKRVPKRKKGVVKPVAPYREESPEALICTACGAHVPPSPAASKQAGAFLCDPCERARPKPPLVSAMTRAPDKALTRAADGAGGYYHRWLRFVRPADDLAREWAGWVWWMLTSSDTGLAYTLVLFVVILLLYWNASIGK